GMSHMDCVPHLWADEKGRLQVGARACLFVRPADKLAWGLAGGFCVNRGVGQGIVGTGQHKSCERFAVCRRCLSSAGRICICLRSQALIDERGEMADPFTIRIFVPDGDPEGVRLIDRMNWTGLGIVFPRGKWPEVR